jgi:hypothetical protein
VIWACLPVAMKMPSEVPPIAILVAKLANPLALGWPGQLANRLCKPYWLTVRLRLERCKPTFFFGFARLAFGLGLAQGSFALLLRQARGLGFGLEAGCFRLSSLAGFFFTPCDLGLAAFFGKACQQLPYVLGLAGQLSSSLALFLEFSGVFGQQFLLACQQLLEFGAGRGKV